MLLRLQSRFHPHHLQYHRRRHAAPLQGPCIAQPPSAPKCPILSSKPPCSSTPLSLCSCRAQNDGVPLPAKSDADASAASSRGEEEVGMAAAGPRKSFWAAVGLIIGTAVGPGMLGLPSATIRSGPFPSTITIVFSWIYVISSIILVAELSFAAMEEDEVEEVSFTALASKALGSRFGAFVAVVYASLSLSLLIACVSGIGSLVVQLFPSANPIVAHALFPCFVGAVIDFFPFKAIDSVNRLLCALMLFSITALVVIGLSVGRRNLLASVSYASWRPEVVLPAIPVAVLTLGFHVITPFVCKIVGDSVYDARKAILIGGTVPLLMVLVWNLVVLGLAGTAGMAFDDPIKLLLSVNISALPPVRGFAFAALATSLIGYSVSFPKQLVDTLFLITPRSDQNVNGDSEESNHSKVTSGSIHKDATTSSSLVMWTVLVVSIFISSFFPEAFARAVDFAGVYANCFLFGILPPVMAWVHRSRKQRSHASQKDLLPGGNIALALLFGIAVALGLWHYEVISLLCMDIKILQLLHFCNKWSLITCLLMYLLIWSLNSHNNFCEETPTVEIDPQTFCFGSFRVFDSRCS